MSEDSADCGRGKRDVAVAGGCGVAAAVLLGLTVFLAGNISGGEARQLLKALMPTTRFFCSAVMTATATVLALMLTLLSLSVSANVQFSDVAYRRLKQIAFYDTLVLVAVTCLLLLHCAPLKDSKEIPAWWFPTIYYTVLVSAAIVAGGMVTVVVMLYSTIRDMIHAVGLTGADHMTDDDETTTEQRPASRPANTHRAHSGSARCFRLARFKLRLET